MDTHNNPINAAVSVHGVAPGAVTADAFCDEDEFEGSALSLLLWGLGGTIIGCVAGFFLVLYVLFPLLNQLSGN